MILGAIEGQIGVLVLMAIFGLINWISSKLNTGKTKPPTSSSAPRPPALPQSPTRTGEGTDEEERVRRFFEALGLPTDPAAPPSRPAPLRPAASAAPAPKRTPQWTPELPVPPIVAPQTVRPTGQRTSPAPRPSAPPALPNAARPPVDDIDPIFEPERTILPELKTPEVREYQSVAARISATPTPGRTPADAASAPNEIQDALRRALASPQGLRTAFVLREILGPPPGLQN